MKISKRQLKRIIREAISTDYGMLPAPPKRSSEDPLVQKILNIATSPADGSFEQAVELAQSLDLIKHPDFKLWNIVDPDTGEVYWDYLSFDEAMDPDKWSTYDDGTPHGNEPDAGWSREPEIEEEALSVYPPFTPTNPIREAQTSTKKYDDDSALKGGQSNLPDALQKGIIDKTVEDREEDEEEARKEKEEKNESFRITKRQLKRIIRESIVQHANEERSLSYEELEEEDPGIEEILAIGEEWASYGKQAHQIQKKLHIEYGYNSEVVAAVVDYLERQGRIKQPQSYQVHGRYRLNPSHPGD